MNEALEMPVLEIRSFPDQHMEDCAKLYVEVFGTHPWNEPWSMEAAAGVIHKVIHKKHFIGYVAVYNGDAVGYLLGYRLSTVFPFHQIYYIHELFVDTKRQNMKIGTRLVQALIHELRKKRIPWVVLLTKKDTHAEKFYKRLGFKRIIPGLSVKRRIIMYDRLARH